MKVVPKWFPDLRQIVPHFATKEFRHVPIVCEIQAYQEYELGPQARDYFGARK